MHVSSTFFIVAVALCLLVGPVRARPGEPPSSGKHTPSNAEVMASPQVQSAMHGAMQILQQMDSHNAKHKPAPSKPRQNHQSDAMRDAMSVARQAFGYAASHPNATDAELKAQADAVMSGIFSRELGGSAAPRIKPQPQPHTQSKKPVNGHDGG